MFINDTSYLKRSISAEIKKNLKQNCWYDASNIFYLFFYNSADFFISGKTDVSIEG